MKGKVYLVGAGPGDYKLMTLKGMECIQKADVLIYDNLINREYLKEVKKDCELIYVGKKSSNHTLSQEEINNLIKDKSLEGKIVTRLKGGDPYVFGRGGEEGQVLNSYGVDFEVVPGITSAIGGLCYAGIPITHRDYASSFHVVTGHLRDDNKENNGINWNALAKINGTLVFLMGVSNIKNICENLISEGKEKLTPVAFITYATRKNQRVITTNLQNAYQDSKIHNLKSPSLIVIGDVVSLREELNFFENKPLYGKNIMVTRSRSQNSYLVNKLSELGASPIEVPTIKIQKIEENIELEKSIINIKNYTYLILTSQNSVEIFFDKLNEMNLDTRVLSNLKICAIGCQTSKEIKKYGIITDIIPQRFIAESLFEELEKALTKNDKVLIPRAKNSRDLLINKIGKICDVDEVITYESVLDKSNKDLIIENIDKADYITFTSSSIVNNFVSIVGDLNKIKDKKTISIGPVTSNTIRENNLDIYLESKNATIDSMIETIIKDCENNND